MATILYPTRGGTASYPNQDLAISLARERGAKLIFMYVSDVRFLDRVASPVLVDVEAELDELGEFMLTMAQDKAERAGVTAEIAVRRGVFRDALKEMIAEHDIETVILGSSDEDAGLTSSDYRAMLAELLQREAGLQEMIIAHDGEIVETYRERP